MLLRHFDQKVQKSRFTECGTCNLYGTILVPFGTTKPPIGTKLVHILLSYWNHFILVKICSKLYQGIFLKNNPVKRKQHYVKKDCKC